MSRTAGNHTSSRAREAAGLVDDCRRSLRGRVPDGVHGDDGGQLGGLPRGQRQPPGRRPPGPGARVLRIEGRDAADVGRLWRRGAGAVGQRDVGAVPRPLRSRRRRRPHHRRAPRAHQAPGHGAGDRRPQVRRRAGGHRPGRAHAPHPRRRARRHAALPGPTGNPAGRPAGRRRGSHPHRGADLRRDPSRHLPGRRPQPPRPRARGQSGAHGRRAGRLEGRPHGAHARAPARRHHVRAGGRRP